MDAHTYPLILIRCRDDALTKEQTVRVVELEIFFLVTLRLLQEKLYHAISQHPAQLSVSRIKEERWHL